MIKQLHLLVTPTRYQYLNLIHHLHTNSWSQNSYDLGNEKLWKGWKNFHQGTNARFGCQEICDGYRIDRTFDKVKENRHYHDFEYNFTISFYFYMVKESISVNYLSIPRIVDSIQKQCNTKENILLKNNNYVNN